MQFDHPAELLERVGRCLLPMTLYSLPLGILNNLLQGTATAQERRGSSRSSPADAS
ncbi:MAG: hypothetical protein R3F17_05860 [Planctomycetota bacterium]